MSTGLTDSRLAKLLELGFTEPEDDEPLEDSHAGESERETLSSLCCHKLPEVDVSPRDPEFGDTLRFIGGFELLHVVNSGGMGVVWEARRPGGAHVALKLLHPALLCNEREVERFCQTSEEAARLRHPNIARVLHVERAVGQPFLVMDLIPGGPITQMGLSKGPGVKRGLWGALLSRLVGPSVSEEQRQLAGLMLKVTQAVYFAHQRGLLHRDLKPSNILLDESGEPKLVDFGLARRLDQAHGSVTSRAIEGALDYMGPEQARGVPESITVTADIYSLGATFYELLTGRVPFRADTQSALLELIKSEIPVTPPRELAPAVHPFVEAVCLRCLEKRSQRRYQSAAELASDLERIVEGHAPDASALSPWKRLLYWARRRPVSARRFLSRFVVFACVLVAGVAFWHNRAQRQQDALRANAAIASGQAGAILFQLSAYASVLKRAVELPVVTPYARLARYESNPSPAFKDASEDFDTLFVANTEGMLRTQWPPAPEMIWDRSFLFRDYFLSARSLGQSGSREVHVAKAFRSERDGEMKFGLSTPIFEGSRWVGVLVALISTDSVFGKVRMQQDLAHTTTLIGPRDLERDGRTRPPFVFLIHDQLQHGDEVAVPQLHELHSLPHRELGAAALQLTYTTPTGRFDYVDPLFGSDRWVAAFAPVGATGYVVVSQSR